MGVRHRSNPLALAVLVCLGERPMHPYEIASTLRQRHKQDSVRLNDGSLYAVVATLQKRRLVKVRETLRDGGLPERTVYELTEQGLVEATDWLEEILSVPCKEYTRFEAALSFLPALAPGVVAGLLRARVANLELELAKSDAARSVHHQQRTPRVLWIEEEYRAALRSAELAFVTSLLSEISERTLEGIEWWHAIHDDASGAAVRPAT